VGKAFFLLFIGRASARLFTKEVLFFFEKRTKKLSITLTCVDGPAGGFADGPLDA